MNKYYWITAAAALAVGYMYGQKMAANNKLAAKVYMLGVGATPAG